MSGPQLVDMDHAWRVGVVAGVLLRRGLEVDFTYDDEANLLPTLKLTLDRTGTVIRLDVQP